MIEPKVPCYYGRNYTSSVSILRSGRYNFISGLTQAVADKLQDFRESLIVSSGSIPGQTQEILNTAF